MLWKKRKEELIELPSREEDNAKATEEWEEKFRECLKDRRRETEASDVVLCGLTHKEIEALALEARRAYVRGLGIAREEHLPKSFDKEPATKLAWVEVVQAVLLRYQLEHEKS